MVCVGQRQASSPAPRYLPEIAGTVRCCAGCCRCLVASSVPSALGRYVKHHSVASEHMRTHLLSQRGFLRCWHVCVVMAPVQIERLVRNRAGFHVDIVIRVMFTSARVQPLSLIASERARHPWTRVLQAAAHMRVLTAPSRAHSTFKIQLVSYVKLDIAGRRPVALTALPELRQSRPSPSVGSRMRSSTIASLMAASTRRRCVCALRLAKPWPRLTLVMARSVPHRPRI